MKHSNFILLVFTFGFFISTLAAISPACLAKDDSVDDGTDSLGKFVDQGDDLLFHEKWDRARKQFKAALAAAPIKGNEENTALVYERISDTYFRQDDMHNAVKQNLVALVHAAASKNELLQAQIHRDLALDYSSLTESGKVEKEYSASLEFYRKCANDESSRSQLLNVTSEYADFLSGQNKEQSALPLYQEVVKLEKEYSPNDTASIATSTRDVAMSYHRLSNDEMAVSIYRMILKMRQFKENRADWRLVAQAFQDLAEATDSIGDNEAAREYYIQAMATRAAHIPAAGRSANSEDSAAADADELDRAGLQTSYGNFLASSPDIDPQKEALKLFQSAQVLQMRYQPSDRAAQIENEKGMGSCLNTLKDSSSALAHFQTEKALRDKLGDVSSVAYAECLLNIGQCLIDLGKPAEAVAPLRKSVALYKSNGEDSTFAKDHLRVAQVNANLPVDKDDEQAGSSFSAEKVDNVMKIMAFVALIGGLVFFAGLVALVIWIKRKA